jgi:hypothetical protein
VLAGLADRLPTLPQLGSEPHVDTAPVPPKPTILLKNDSLTSLDGATSISTGNPTPVSSLPLLTPAMMLLNVWLPVLLLTAEIREGRTSALSPPVLLVLLVLRPQPPQPPPPLPPPPPPPPPLPPLLPLLLLPFRVIRDASEAVTCGKIVSLLRVETKSVKLSRTAVVSVAVCITSSRNC